MYPINNINGIENQERLYNNSHGIMLLFVKPSDRNAEEYINNFNYWHKKTGQSCAIYAIGYSQIGYNQIFDDVQIVNGTCNNKWEYSDECFISVCDQLEERLKNWTYSGEPELIFLQNNPNSKNSVLDFRNYNYIDINYGIEKGYIDSFPRFMEHLIKACKTKNDSNIMNEATKLRFSGRKILEIAFKYDNKIPCVIKDIIGDKMFFKGSRNI